MSFPSLKDQQPPLIEIDPCVSRPIETVANEESISIYIYMCVCVCQSTLCVMCQIIIICYIYIALF